MGGAFSTAFQPSRLAAGLLVALLIWLPGLGWDALTGRTLDATGFTGEPYDDAQQSAVQATLRKLAADYAPDLVFEGARVPALDLAAELQTRAATAPDAASRDMLLIAASRAGSLAPVGAFEALERAWAASAALAVDGVLSAAPSDVAAGLRLATWDVPRAVWRLSPVFAVVFGLWCALALAVGAGAIARMEALQCTGRSVPTSGEGFAFAAARWGDLAAAWLAPLGLAAVLGVTCVAWGFLFRGEFTGWLGGALYVVPLALGSIAGLVLVVGALGAAFAPAAVACDGLDALDASQRGAIYAIGRPGLWCAMVLTVVAVAAAGLAALRLVVWVMTGFTASAVSLGADSMRGGAVGMPALGVLPDASPVAFGGPGEVAAWWVALVSAAATGAFLSLVSGLFTRAYLALRERCDGQGRSRVWPYAAASDVTDEPPAAAP